VAVRYEESLARARERGEYETSAEAEGVTRALVDVLADRIIPEDLEDLEDLAAQLPEPS
jgi:uncharacterized protein (DUF2267 family)